jgi:hypothetical protein
MVGGSGGRFLGFLSVFFCDMEFEHGKMIRFASLEKHKKTKKDIRKQLNVFICEYSKCFFLFFSVFFWFFEARVADK